MPSLGGAGGRRASSPQPDTREAAKASTTARGRLYTAKKAIDAGRGCPGRSRPVWRRPRMPRVTERRRASPEDEDRSSSGAPASAVAEPALGTSVAHHGGSTRERSPFRSVGDTKSGRQRIPTELAKESRLVLALTDLMLDHRQRYLHHTCGVDSGAAGPWQRGAAL